MSRYELAELEEEMRRIAEAGEEEEIPDELDIAEMKKDPLYRRYMEKMERLQRLRHGVIKRYFEKNKYKKTNRNEIIEAAEKTEGAFAEVMGDKHVHFLDAHPEIKKFLMQVNKDEVAKTEVVVESAGRKIGDLPDIARL